MESLSRGWVAILIDLESRPDVSLGVHRPQAKAEGTERNVHRRTECPGARAEGRGSAGGPSDSRGEQNVQLQDAGKSPRRQRTRVRPLTRISHKMSLNSPEFKEPSGVAR